MCIAYRIGEKRGMHNGLAPSRRLEEGVCELLNIIQIMLLTKGAFYKNYFSLKEWMYFKTFNFSVCMSDYCRELGINELSLPADCVLMWTNLICLVLNDCGNFCTCEKWESHMLLLQKRNDCKPYVMSWCKTLRKHLRKKCFSHFWKENIRFHLSELLAEEALVRPLLV